MLRIQRIRLETAARALTRWALHLQHPFAPFGEETRQPRPVRAGAFQRPDPITRRQPVSKPQCLPVTASSRRDRQRPPSALRHGVDDHHCVMIRVRVHTNDKADLFCEHASTSSEGETRCRS